MINTPLKQLCRLRMGETIIACDCTGDGLPIYSADTGTLPWAYSTHTLRHFKRGTLVIGARGSIGSPRLPKAELFSATQTTIVAEPLADADVISEFLLYWLQEVRWNDFALQQAVPMLTVAALGEILVDLPLKPEQEAIVRIAGLMDQAIEQTEALLAKQQRIKTGLMRDLLTRGLDAKGELRDPSTHRFKKTDIGDIPIEWNVMTLESLVPSSFPICYGIVQVGPHTHGGVPTIAIRDLNDIRLEDLHRTETARERPFFRSRCEPGDVLISIKASTGRIGIVPKWFVGNISRDIARIRLLRTESPEFFKYQLQSAAGQSRLDTITVGTTRKELSIAPLRALFVARPEPAEQRAIAVQIEKCEGDLAELADMIAKLRRLKAGLMHDLLTGEVSVAPLLAGGKPNC